MPQGFRKNGEKLGFQKGNQYAKGNQPNKTSFTSEKMKGNTFGRGNSPNRTSFKKGYNPWNKGKIGVQKHTEKTKRKIGLKISNLLKGRTGELNNRWIKDRSLLKIREDRRSSAYINWRKEVWLRDMFKCRINNQDCKGRLEAHHILSWRDFPELRYNINNGITLCYYHHPRKWIDEKKLEFIFKKLLKQ